MSNPVGVQGASRREQQEKAQPETNCSAREGHLEFHGSRCTLDSGALLTSEPPCFLSTTTKAGPSKPTFQDSKAFVAREGVERQVGTHFITY